MIMVISGLVICLIGYITLCICAVICRHNVNSHTFAVADRIGYIATFVGLVGVIWTLAAGVSK